MRPACSRTACGMVTWPFDVTRTQTSVLTIDSKTGSKASQRATPYWAKEVHVLAAGGPGERSRNAVNPPLDDHRATHRSGQPRGGVRAQRVPVFPDPALTRPGRDAAVLSRGTGPGDRARGPRRPDRLSLQRHAAGRDAEHDRDD